jgi:hypothetical protein
MQKYEEIRAGEYKLSKFSKKYTLQKVNIILLIFAYNLLARVKTFISDQTLLIKPYFRDIIVIIPIPRFFGWHPYNISKDILVS